MSWEMQWRSPGKSFALFATAAGLSDGGSTWRDQKGQQPPGRCQGSCFVSSAHLHLWTLPFEQIYFLSVSLIKTLHFADLKKPLILAFSSDCQQSVCRWCPRVQTHRMLARGAPTCFTTWRTKEFEAPPCPVDVRAPCHPQIGSTGTFG